MSLPSPGPGHFHQRLHEIAPRLLWLGLLLALLGLAAIAFPEFGTLAATLLTGWTLLIAGVLIFVSSFWIHGTGPFFATNLFGLLAGASGVFLLFNPLAGAMALTLILGIMFMFQGAAELMFALEIRPAKGWGGMLASGLASVLLSVVIVSGWPGISTIALGLLLGINFLTTGIAYIFVSRYLKM
ncbi:HdeD family acid-resistance protein [Acidocella sp.]|uniref:HdeD family acid-resistance protein n=1 Tax=Acidocella sp. TaxID=50710 RepID=UPI002624557B|nr:DUF308 domain-containing protein [Acidocella sp.]